MADVPPLAVYVHWPYCARICPYCDFNVVRDRGQREQALLVDAIVADLAGQATLMGERRLTSIFFGGGTPSLMQPDWVAAIIAQARRLWPTDQPVEISLEANPTDAEAARFASFREAGVERLSLGVQSFDDEALVFLGRNHSAAEARAAIATAQAAFPRVSLDLIYALPDQTPSAWAKELEAAADLGVEHISPYQLTIEQGTAFDRHVRRGRFAPPRDEAGAALYETTQAVLEAAGFHAYEVSNHAQGEAARSRHNLAYWRGWDYVGAGPGAHGRLTGPKGRMATVGARQIGAYLRQVAETGLGFSEMEPLSAREAAIERLLLGLRSLEGVAESEVAEALDAAEARRLRDQGLLAPSPHHLIATPAGRAVLDGLTAALVRDG